MKKLNFIVLLQLFFLSNSAFAQDFWELLPFPDSLDITCMAVNQQGDIFVGTNTNTAYDGVFRSQDQGQTWELVLDMGLYGPSSLAINENGEIFVLGAWTGWYLTKSTDNGQTWNSLSIPDYGGNVKIVAEGNDILFVSQWAANGALLLKSENGGLDWEVVFTTENHTSEYIHDIAFAPDGNIYISLNCFFPDMGGVYKSTNGGETWEFIGLLNHQVKEVEVNAQGDLFIGVYSDFIGGEGIGIYALYHDSPQLIECLYGPSVNGLAINSVGDIYAGTGFPDGVMVSKDNGSSFFFKNNGLPYFPIGIIEKDSKNFIYALLDGPSNHLYRTIASTVGITHTHNYMEHHIIVNTNPVPEMLQGRIGEKIPNGIYIYTISDISGRRIVSDELSLLQNAFIIDVSFLPAGYYTLSIQYNEIKYTAKIIKG